MEFHQYQIVIVNLDPTIGSEIKKTRPCVIVSPDEMKHLLIDYLGFIYHLPFVIWNTGMFVSRKQNSTPISRD